MSELSRSYSFAPIVGDNPTILILGTLPSKVSLLLHEYYANKRNRFWRIISTLFDENEPTVYSDKKAMLLKHGIAVWDVARSAVRPGSLDANIMDEEMNPIDEFVRKYPTIKTIVFNGKAAAKKYKQHGGRAFGSIKMLTLYSTSPANCQYSDDVIIENWKQIL